MVVLVGGARSDVAGGAARLRCSSQSQGALRLLVYSSAKSRGSKYDITVTPGPSSLDSLPPGIESDVLSLPLGLCR